MLSGGNHVGSKKLRFEILSKAEYQYSIYESKTKVSLHDNIVEITADEYEQPNYARIYRKCEQNDELIVKILFQQKQEPYGYVNLYISQEKDSISNNLCEYSVGRLGNNEFGATKEYMIIPVKDHLDDSFVPYYLKITKEVSLIVTYVSKDGVKWNEIYRTHCAEIGLNRDIGIALNYETNNYYNWLYANHIQIYANKNFFSPIDFILAPYKNYKSYSYNPLMNFFPENRYVIEKSYDSIVDYVKFQVENNKYVELNLDEFYLHDRGAYRKTHYFHQNLVYGFDNKCVYLFGIGSFGKPKTSKIPYEDFAISYEAIRNQNNIIYSFECAAERVYLDIKAIYWSLKDYRDGLLRNESEFNLINPGDIAIGLDIYDYFCREGMIEFFLSDIRIAYFICEHKKIMLGRIKYFEKNNIIPYANENGIFDMYKIIANKANTLMNIAIKNTIIQSNEISGKTKKLLLELKEAEFEAINSFIDLLESKYNLNSSRLGG